MYRTFVFLVIFALTPQGAHALESINGPAMTCPLKTLKEGKSLSLESLKGKVVYLNFGLHGAAPVLSPFPT